MTQNHRSPRPKEIQIPVPIRIEQIRALSPRDKRRIAPHSAECTHRRINAPRQKLFSTKLQLARASKVEWHPSSIKVLSRLILMTQAEQAQIEGRPLLLYDGVCVLCNGVVRFILRHDKQSAFRFTPLESPLGRELLPPNTQHNASEGVVLITATLTPFHRIYRRSDAVAQALQLLGSPWRTLGKAMALIPHSLREFGYTIVARLRYRLFGRYTTCPVPTPEQRNRILGIYKE